MAVFVSDLEARLAAHAQWLHDPRTGARLNLSGYTIADRDVSGHDLREADLSDADLRNTLFNDCRLDGAEFRRADARGAIFDDSEARGVNFDGADLSGASLERANLQDAAFTNVTLTDAEFGWANLIGTVWTGARRGDTTLTQPPVQIIGYSAEPVLLWQDTPLDTPTRALLDSAVSAVQVKLEAIAEEAEEVAVDIKP